MPGLLNPIQKDGVKYEPEDTFRLRMHQHITTHHPQKISVVSELCATIAEVRKGHVHLIIGFSGKHGLCIVRDQIRILSWTTIDWPLVTIPSEASGIAPAPGTMSSPFSGGDSASVEKTATVIIAPGDEGTRTPSAADFPTQSYAPTALVRDDRGAPPSASDHIPLEILCPAFAYFMSLIDTTSEDMDEAFVLQFSQTTTQYLELLSDAPNSKKLGIALSELLKPEGEDLSLHDLGNGTICMFCRMENEDYEASAPLLVFKSERAEPNFDQGRDDIASAMCQCDNVWDKQHVSKVYFLHYDMLADVE